MENTIWIWAAFALATLLYYWTPLFSDQATIQWDTVSVHYSAQKYFEQTVHRGHLPTWTPFEYSGMPFLADPQTAAWYPPHWPFFLVGITPRALEWELALHAFLALGGMFLLARRLTGHAGVSILAAVLYAGSGFFAGHSSHLGMFETAALAPWLLWSAHRAIETGKLRDQVITGLLGGLIVLAGHFQTSLYAFSALTLFVIATIASRDDRNQLWRRGAVLLALTAVLAVAIPAIQVLPGLELAAQSIRAEANYHRESNGMLRPGALATLVAPNYYGVISGGYKGPADITQFYYYGGLLLIPLAACCAFKRGPALWIPVALVIPAMWYATGPRAGLYSIVTLLPGFKSVRAPVHVWFVVAMGLALAAASGAKWLNDRFQKSWLVSALILFSAGDIWYWNMASNPLAYERSSFAEDLGNAFENYQSHLGSIKAQGLYRIWSPFASTAFGPLNSSLESETEVTYGYNPLELSRYADYLDLAGRNPKLLNGLAVTNKVEVKQGTILANHDALPRVSVAERVQFAATPEIARAALVNLDPAHEVVAENSSGALADPDISAPVPPEATHISIVNYEPTYYRIRFSGAHKRVVRIAVPYFPGWTGAVDGHPTAVFPVDYALSGMVVPAGEHELTFAYRSTYLRIGAAISGLALVAGVVALVLLP